MSARARWLFLGLILTQAAHSVEEYATRLYDVLPPARLVSGLVSTDRAFGFAVVNVALVAFGAWAYLARVRPGRGSGVGWAWFWSVFEAANGVGHLVFVVVRGGYFPGAWTAPPLLVLAVSLGRALVATKGTP